MSEHTMMNKAILAGTLALSMLGLGTVYAEAPADQDPRVRTSNLSGGFYNDRYTTDNWFYDYYDMPSDQSDPRLTRQSRVGNETQISRSERDRWADAAHPMPGTINQPQPSSADSAYSRYYDEPWFYEDRDPAYAMPTTTASGESFRPAVRDQEHVKGVVQGVKQVRNKQSGGQNTIALVRLNDGRRTIVDLGPTQRTLNFALAQGDDIQVRGQREEIGPYSVLMAHEIRSGANRAFVDRDSMWREADYRQVDGSIQRFGDLKTRPNGQLHRVAAVRTSDGRLAIVDIGPSPAQNVPANAAPGDRITANGQVVHVGNYPVLLADRISMNNDSPVRVVRPGSEYVNPTQRSFESSHVESATDPTCVGGGCESGTVGRTTPRNPLSNAMDGDIGSERR